MTALQRIKALQNELQEGINKCHNYPKSSTINTSVARMFSQIQLELSEIKGEIYRGNVQ